MKEKTRDEKKESQKRKSTSNIKPGDKFGRLTILYECKDRYISPGGSTAIKWHCICDCENHTEIDVITSSLTSGNTRSCGCLSKENIIKKGINTRFKSNSEFIINGKNKYDLSGEFGIGWTTSGDKFYFDLEDYDKIKDYIWGTKISGNGKNNIKKYVGIRRGTKTIYLHRFLYGLPSKKEDLREVDHINHCTFDNRKSNLRICEHFENLIAQKTSVRNKSGRKGVYWDKERDKWVAKISKNNKEYFLGRFDTFEEAVEAREKAEKIYHGEFVYLNNF